MRWVTRYYFYSVEGRPRVSRFATTCIDEAILTRAYAQDQENVWAVAKDGVILYAQYWKPILANAVTGTGRFSRR